MAEQTMIVLDIFSGVGGLSLGFKKAGFMVAGVEIDPRRADVFYRNISHSVVGDARHVPARGGVIGIVAGPPCRPYSAATPIFRRGQKHPEYMLDREVARAAARLRPEFIAVEEVPSWNPEPLSRSLKQIEYIVDYRIIDFSMFGVPTARRRVVMIASRKIDPKSIFKELERMIEKAPKPVELLEDLPRRPCRSRVCRRGGRVILDHVAPRIRSRARNAIKHIPPGMSMRDAHIYGLLDASAYVKNPRALASYKFYRVPLDKPMKVVPHPRRSVVLHPIYDRHVTIRELARIHTFPDWFSFQPLDVDSAMRAIADAVPPKFSEKLAKAIMIHL